MLLPFPGRRSIGQRIGQRHMRVICNHAGYLPHGSDHGSVIIFGTQVWNHSPADIADAGIVQDPFEPVAHINAVFVIVHRQQNQHAPV